MQQIEPSGRLSACELPKQTLVKASVHNCIRVKFVRMGVHPSELGEDADDRSW